MQTLFYSSKPLTYYWIPVPVILWRRETTGKNATIFKNLGFIIDSYCVKRSLTGLIAAVKKSLSFFDTLRKVILVFETLSKKREEAKRQIHI